MRGRQGIVAGIDYRGVEVYAAVRKIADSAWVLVTKIDRAEVEAPIERMSRLFTLITLALIAGGGGGDHCCGGDSRRRACARMRAAPGRNAMRSASTTAT